MSNLIRKQDAIDEWKNDFKEYINALNIPKDDYKGIMEYIDELPSAQPEGWVKIPDTGIDDVSDGFHTFRQLYYQRMMLFATIVKQNKDKAWKSLRHEDGELCFGGEWFIVGVDTPKGTYTYHYEANYYSMFDCKELERAKHWDGHTEKDVTRLLSLPSVQLEQPQWIPVTEALPNDDNDYLVMDDEGNRAVGYYRRDAKAWDSYCFGWLENRDEPPYGIETVIAWMPLPKAYKIK